MVSLQPTLVAGTQVQLIFQSNLAALDFGMKVVSAYYGSEYDKI